MPDCPLFCRLVVASLTTLIALAASAAGAAAENRHARLSDDLLYRLAGGDTSSHTVIVSSSAARVREIAQRHGLTVRKWLKTGAVLDVPAGSLAALAQDEGVDQLSGNHRLRSQMAVTNTAIGADQVWEGIGGLPGATGRGVGVAVVDSGVADVPALRGRVVATVDFTDRRGRGTDRFGHGTHVAGIVAASGRNGAASGVAPGAHPINLKVLDEHGEGTVGDVIAAIDWAIDHRRRYRIRVVNLSLGGTPMQSWRDDPLCQAVQRAHDAGVVVVASAGNRGKTADGTPAMGGVTVPGACPHAITVGALNTKGTAFRSDDEVASYSSKGPTRYDRLIKPDLVAPGNRIRGLLAPGATLAAEHPELVIDTGNEAELELSGTSMAAAVVSGAVSLVLEASPRLLPIRIRLLLQYSAERIPDEPVLMSGAGRLHIASTVSALRGVAIPPVSGEQQVAGQIAFNVATVNAIIWGNSIDAIIWGNSLDAIIWGNSTEAIIWEPSSRRNARIR